MAGPGQHMEWHQLFDQLCDRRGFYDNTELASALCVRTGRTRHEDFEAAKKKLRAWRNGERLPRRSNLLAVAAILGVSADPELERRWVALHETAAGARRSDDLLPEEEGRDGNAVTARGALPRILSRPVYRRIATGCLGAACIALFFLAGTPVSGSLPIVSYEGHIIMPLGMTRLIHGENRDCGNSPPDWEEILPRIPATSLGTFEDGGIARKAARHCGEEVLVRAVRFTAKATGALSVSRPSDA